MSGPTHDEVYRLRREADVGAEAVLLATPYPESQEQYAEVGRRIVEKVDAAMAEFRTCSKDNRGHRYHEFKGKPERLYCRRCGTIVVIRADG